MLKLNQLKYVTVLGQDTVSLLYVDLITAASIQCSSTHLLSALYPVTYSEWPAFLSLYQPLVSPLRVL